jgi:hypothetical protein
MNDFLKTEEDWQREHRNAEGRLQRLCHCGKRAHFGVPNGDWVCLEHWRSPYKREREASTGKERL